MNDSELDAKLKAARVPERGEDYWEFFPQRVLARSRTMPAERVPRGWLPHLAWASAIAMVCLMAGCWFVPGARQPQKTVCFALLRNMRSLQAELTQFPQHIRSVMQVERGLQSLIEEQP